MKRTFHPVGQGAFYSEEFMDENEKVVFRVVYDCGCRQGKQNQDHGIRVLKETITAWKQNGHCNIDYLFISHFDFDHVSLLKVLQDEGVCVGRVIAPLLDRSEKEFLIEFYERCVITKNIKSIINLIKDPGQALKSKVIQIEPLKNNEIAFHYFEDNNDNGGSDICVQSGVRLRVKIPNAGVNWCYIPCNYDDQDRGREFRELLRAKFGIQDESINLEEFSVLMQHWDPNDKRALRKLKDVYDKVDGNINENSMTVYSGPTGNGYNTTNGSCRFVGNDNICQPEKRLQCLVNFGRKCNNCRDKRAACVYTGDVDLNKIMIQEWYKRLWDNVGTIQVPHHGSRLSFDTKPFSRGHSYCCPISCSDKCYYKHPHTCVTNSLIRLGNFPIRVTETQELVQRFYVI